MDENVELLGYLPAFMVSRCGADQIDPHPRKPPLDPRLLLGGGCHTDAYFANASNLGFFHRVNIIKIFHAAIYCIINGGVNRPTITNIFHLSAKPNTTIHAASKRYRTNFLVVPNLLLSASRQPPRRCQEALTKHPIYVHHGWRKTFLLNPEQGDSSIYVLL